VAPTVAPTSNPSSTSSADNTAIGQLQTIAGGGANDTGAGNSSNDNNDQGTVTAQQSAQPQPGTPEVAETLAQLVTASGGAAGIKSGGFLGGGTATPASGTSIALADNSQGASSSTPPLAKQPVSQLMPGLLQVAIPLPAGSTDQSVGSNDARYSVMGNKALW
jgi:hypothetical protein